MTAPKHYLEKELEQLFMTDPKMWEFIQRGSLDGIWYWDLTKPDAEWMSREMWALFGIDPDTKRHDPAEWQDLIFEEDLQVALKNFEAHCADPNHPYDQVVRYRHADGSTVWVRCRGIAIRDDSGKPIRMLGAHNDITAIKVAEEEARAALRNSAAANEELRSFAYSLSHDLKSPSNTIDMLLQEILTVDQGNLSEDQRALLEIAETTASQMRSLIDEMLGYTQLISERPKPEPVDLAKLVQSVRTLLGSLISESGATLAIKGSLPVLNGYPAQMRMLIQNLIENAIKYSDPDRPPVIEIAGFDDAQTGTVGFTVSDNGLGIAQEHLNQIFDMFKRLHRGDEVAGTGLGLTLCRRVAHNHGGDIQVTSEPGKGTTFKVTLKPQPI